MKDNELASITHQLRELQGVKNRRPTASILTILQASEREIQNQFEHQMQMGNNLLQTELFDQAVRLIKNCDDTCADIKEEYQKELTVFAIVHQKCTIASGHGNQFSCNRSRRHDGGLGRVAGN
jgi:hypothetical protein